jgi:hypothetical protein
MHRKPRGSSQGRPCSAPSLRRTACVHGRPRQTLPRPSSMTVQSVECRGGALRKSALARGMSRPSSLTDEGRVWLAQETASWCSIAQTRPPPARPRGGGVGLGTALLRRRNEHRQRRGGGAGALKALGTRRRARRRVCEVRLGWESLDLSARRRLSDVNSILCGSGPGRGKKAAAILQNDPYY